VDLTPGFQNLRLWTCVWGEEKETPATRGKSGLDPLPSCLTGVVGCYWSLTSMRGLGPGFKNNGTVRPLSVSRFWERETWKHYPDGPRTTRTVPSLFYRAMHFGASNPYGSSLRRMNEVPTVSRVGVGTDFTDPGPSVTSKLSIKKS
jgi:hypothetical protein